MRAAGILPEPAQTGSSAPRRGSRPRVTRSRGVTLRLSLRTGAGPAGHQRPRRVHTAQRREDAATRWPGAPGRNRTCDPLLRRVRGRRGVAPACVSCEERACRRGHRAAPRPTRRPYTAPLRLGPWVFRTACAPSGRGAPTARCGRLDGSPPARLRRGAPRRPPGPEPRRAPPGASRGTSGNPRPAWHRT